MCVTCAHLSSFNPDCIFSGEANEGAGDWGETSATAGSMTVGGSVTGELTLGDRDWIAIDLVAGETYTISLDGSGSSPVSDTYLRLWTPGSTSANSGTLAALDDDGGPGFYSEITYTATTSGTFYISAGSYNDGYSGGYTVSVNTAAPTAPGTMDEIADFLVNGYWEDTGRAARSWNVGSDNAITYDVSSLSAAYQQYAEIAFQTWTDLTGIQFIATSSFAEITFQDTDLGSAYSSSSVSGSTITSNLINVGSDWEALAGSDYTLQTFIHEIGHTLGLGHAGAYNGNATYGSDDTFSNDSWQSSIMSYFSQTNNTTINASFAYLLTPMLADIIAIQSIYGTSTTTRTGNTVYGYNSNAGNLYNLDGLTSFNYALTIFDSGGIDTLDLSGTSVAVTLNLAAEGISSIMGETGNLIIARGVVIENAIGGSGNDTISGNSANNVLEGGLGNDIIDGLTGNDRISGGNGNDTISGGWGRDTAWGGIGNDIINGDGGNDTLFGQGGSDRIAGGDGNDTISGGWGADNAWGGDGNDTINGDGGNDRLFGQDGSDRINGGDGNDTIGGGSGWDTVWGGTGNDIINGDGGNDRLFGQGGSDRIAGGDGNDTIAGGWGIDTVWGGSGSDTINGDSGNDRLFGQGGFDTINGGSGDDVMTGGFGRDTFVFSGAFDRDTITDFDATSGDYIDLSGVSSITGWWDLRTSHMTASGNDVIINAFGGNSIVLQNVALGDLDATDFIF